MCICGTLCSHLTLFLRRPRSPDGFATPDGSAPLAPLDAPASNAPRAPPPPILLPVLLLPARAPAPALASALMNVCEQQNVTAWFLFGMTTGI